MVEAAVLKDTSPRSAASIARPIRLLVLTPKPSGLSPGQRFRLEQWAPRVAADHGIAMDFVPFESPRLTELLYQSGHRAEKAAWVLFDFARRAREVFRARRYDGVVVYREAALIGPAIYERAFRVAGVPMFFDFDDAIWQPGQISSANGVFSALHFWGKTSTTCRLSRGVIVGNDYLASYARKRNLNVFVVPTSIELDRYPVQPELTSEKPFVVAWSGSTHTLQHFEHAREPLERLAKELPLVVKVICNKPPERPIDGAENIFVPWSERGEAEAVGAAHVGIMPLPDDDYTRGKCGLKALQFMATGRPVVISPVGMNKELVTTGHNGFLASTTDEWTDALRRLAASPVLRQRLGRAGRETIEARYSADVVAGLFANAIRQSLAPRFPPGTRS
ncbi:MAG: glycosyltransferase [Labilithrix sp.]|nr:glycosyltransferase [Labilithrix sp.]